MPPSELLAEEVVGHLELGEEQDKVEELAHHKVGKVPRVVMEDCLVVLHKLLNDSFLEILEMLPKAVSNTIIMQVHIQDRFNREDLNDAIVVLGVLTEHDGTLAIRAEGCDKIRLQHCPQLEGEVEDCCLQCMKRCYPDILKVASFPSRY